MFVWLAPSISWSVIASELFTSPRRLGVRTVVLQANRPASWLFWEKSQSCSGWDQKLYKSNSPFCLRVSMNLLEDSDFLHPRQAEILTRRQSRWVNLHRYQGQQWRGGDCSVRVRNSHGLLGSPIWLSVQFQDLAFEVTTRILLIVHGWGQFSLVWDLINLSQDLFPNKATTQTEEWIFVFKTFKCPAFEIP